ncbi:MAG TPA: MOSC domain-containing protein [Bryobacteraceae bacterium]|nr:MOSC domain-containing protein [Bryobacteraceae bacterium]
MTGSILQISVSPGGVPKHAIPVGILTPAGLESDHQSHPAIHGGPQQAVLLITAEGIAELAAQGFPLTHGSLGENLTTNGIPRQKWRTGQHWHIGPEVVIEITKRRAPCQALNVYGPGLQAAIYDSLAAAGDPSSPKWGLSGFYASVVRPGIIQPGDEIALVP